MQTDKQRELPITAGLAEKTISLSGLRAKIAALGNWFDQFSKIV